MNRRGKAGLPQATAAAPHVIPRHSILLGVLLVLIASVPRARAAGGHHAVDDAAILEPGQCYIETWLGRETRGARRLLHAGPACRVAGVDSA